MTAPELCTRAKIDATATPPAGGSIVATLPKETADRYNIKPGDELFVVETDRGPLLTPYDPNFDIAMAAYEQFSRKYRNALKKLAE